jgi:hypothetical protein
VRKHKKTKTETDRLHSRQHLHNIENPPTLHPTPHAPKQPTMLYRYDGYEDYLTYFGCAQPLPISVQPTIHLDSAAARLGLTQEEMGEILADQEEWMREKEEQEWRREGHTVPEETHQQQQGL